MSSASSSSSSASEAAASDEEGPAASAEAPKPEGLEGESRESGVWGHLASILPKQERERLERETVERAKEEETGS